MDFNLFEKQVNNLALLKLNIINSKYILLPVKLFVLFVSFIKQWLEGID